MRFKRSLHPLAAGLLAVASALAGNSKPIAKSIGNSLMCQCGCPETVTLCNHLNCSSRTEMQASIQKEIDAGKEETTILQDFVLRYGVKVLATPPPKGFNSLVWILPGGCLIAGLVILIVITRRWRKPLAEPGAAAVASADPKLLAAVEEEMKSSGFEAGSP